MVLVPQAIQTPQLSTGLPALVDPANECIRSATEGSAGAVRSAESGLRNANCERLEGIKVVSKGEEKGRAKPPGMAMGQRYRDWPGGVWGRQPVWHRSAPALVAAIDKRKKVQPGNRRYRYLASSAATAPCKPETTGLFKLPSFMAVFCSVLAVALRVAEASHPVEPYSSQRPTQVSKGTNGTKALGSLYIGEKYKIWDCKE
ncbi:hypothetical protein Trihar35433_6466 [Trichoderma harzianum]|nr:hypothetical protein Trihar35433_6466 [Trichoderma harzianum]